MRCVAAPELKHAAHHGRQEELCHRRPVLPRHRSQAHARVALRDLHGVPRVERNRRGESLVLQLSRGVLGGDDWKVFAEPLLGYAVEVVAVVVREDAKVQGRELLDVERGVRKALGGQAVAEVHVVARVQEVRVCEDREARVVQHDRRRADEKYRAVSKVRVCVGGGR